jgi:hypothetical protein
MKLTFKEALGTHLQLKRHPNLPGPCRAMSREPDGQFPYLYSFVPARCMCRLRSTFVATPAARGRQEGSPSAPSPFQLTQWPDKYTLVQHWSS